MDADEARRCSIEGCDQNHYARGWCCVHYNRWKRHGDPLTKKRAELVDSSMQERLERRLVRDDKGCWLWTGVLDRDGYGMVRAFQPDRGMKLVHRMSYEIYVGPIPDGMQLDHLCRVRKCAEPSHLEPVTSRENTLRSPIALCAVNARKTQCKRGHPFDSENTQITTSGSRKCRACHRDACRRSEERRKTR